MILLIAVDGGGCHSFSVEISERRYNRPDYLEALYNSIEMVFKKLKWHKGKMDITITEVRNYDAERTDEGQKQEGKATVLENDAPSGDLRTVGRKGVSTHYFTNKSRDKGTQKKPSRG